MRVRGNGEGRAPVEVRRVPRFRGAWRRASKQPEGLPSERRTWLWTPKLTMPDTEATSMTEAITMTPSNRLKASDQ